MSEHTIKVEWQQLERIIVDELRWDLENTLEAIENIKMTGKGFCTSLDPAEDIENLEALSFALAIVLKHYGGFENDCTS